MATTTATVSAQDGYKSLNTGLPVPRGTVSANITFFADPPDHAVPFNYVQDPPPGFPQRNYGQDNRLVAINDMRGQESEFSLESEGFAGLQHVESAMTYEDWERDETVHNTYYAEVESLLLSKVAGARRIFLFDHTIRRTAPGAPRAPVTRAHIDQTTKAALERVQLHLPDEADELLKGRVRIINVWRPLRGPVTAYPLAMADSQSLEDRDLVAVEHRYPNRVGETFGVRYGSQQRWWYWSGMETDERILLQCFDSQGGGKTPHTACVDDRSQDGRESIEVRALVLG